MCLSSVLRLFMITFLILWSVADIETYAITQPQSRIEKNKNFNQEVRSTGSVQSNRNDNNTGSISTDANPDIYLKTTSERSEIIQFSETTTTKVTKVKVNLDEIEDKVVTNTSEIIKPGKVNGTISRATTEAVITNPTPQTNILSMTTNRSRRRGKNKNETSNNNTTQDPPTAKKTTHARAGTGAKAGRILGDDLSMIDVDDDADGEVNVPNTKHMQINTHSIKKIDQYSKTLLNKEARTTFAPGTDSATDALKPQSHIYKVNSNYKRYKKLNIVPPKPLWRDPNDNSWRNESISSLGIKFKPKANTTAGFQFRKKDLSELDTLASDTENITGPGLRERLEKLSEIRKSKKKCNASLDNSDDDFIDYENETSDPAHTETTYTESPVIYQDTIMKTTITKSTPATAETPETASHLNYQRGEKRFLQSSLDDSKSDSKTNKTEISQKDFEIVIANSKFHETEYKNEKPKNITIFQSIKYNQFDYDSDVENNYEYDQYELNVSKDLLNSSESWSEKKTVNTEQNPTHVTETSGLTEFTKMLDSLAEYLNSNKGNTPGTAVTVPTHSLTANNFGEMYKYTRLQAIDGYTSSPIEPGTTPKFTRTEDLPIGPGNKDKISWPQSNSYNTIPHKQISVQYNNTVIHHTAQENFKDYSIPVVIKAVYRPIIPIISNNGNNMENNFHQNIDSHRFKNFPIHRKITAQIGPSISQINMERHGPVLKNVNIGPIVPAIGPIYQNIGSNPPNTYEHNIEPVSQNIGAMHNIIANHRTVLANIPLFDSVASNPMNANYASLQHQEDILLHSATSPIPIVEIFPNNEAVPKNTVAADQGDIKHIGNHNPVFLHNTNQHESRYGARNKPQNSILRNAPSQVSMLQDIVSVGNVDNVNHQTQMPILYNNTVLHNVHKENYNAVPNSYLKGIYDEMLSTKFQDKATPSYGDEYQENITAELPTDYRLHY